MAYIIPKYSSLCKLRRDVRGVSSKFRSCCVILAMIGLSGCSMSFPMAGLMGNDSDRPARQQVALAAPTQIGSLVKPVAIATEIPQTPVAPPPPAKPSIFASMAGSSITKPAEDVDMTATASIAPLPPQFAPAPAPALNPALNRSGLAVPAAKAPVLPLVALSPLAAHVAPADIPAMRSALNSALNLVHPVQSVAWSNPYTGSNGAIVPTAEKVSADPENCRAFVTVIRTQANAAGQTFQGSACRDDNGRWNVHELAPSARSL